MLDQLLVSLTSVCSMLLPILGVLVLIYLVLLLRKLITLLTKAEALLTNVDSKVTQLDKPLNTINSLCTTVDGVHEATVNGVNSAIDYLVANMGQVIEWFKEVVEKRKKGNVVQSFNDENNGGN